MWVDLVTQSSQFCFARRFFGIQCAMPFRFATEVVFDSKIQCAAGQQNETGTRGAGEGADPPPNVVSYDSVFRFDGERGTYTCQYGAPRENDQDGSWQLKTSSPLLTANSAHDKARTKRA